MSNYLATRLADLLPPANTASTNEQMRGAVGAFLGLGLTAWLCWLWKGVDGVWLFTPMGASAVLLFCLPASPLAQPWSVIGGNMVSAAAGVVCFKLFGDATFTAPLATAVAIAMMFSLRCLHPPGGATAITAVLASPDVHGMGFEYVFMPVALNCMVMVLAAFTYNNLTGRRYPHALRSPLNNVHATADAAPTARLGFQREDLDAVLAQYGQVLDVSRDDLENIILATETHAYERRFGIITCGAIMSRDVVTVEFGTDLGDAWRAMRYHHVHAMPVVNRARRVVGMLVQGDFLRHSDLDDYRTLGARLRNLIRRSGLTHSERPEVVGQIMSHEVQRAYVDTPIVELVPLMANSGLHHIPVLDREERLAGMVTQSDIIAALYQSRLALVRPPAAGGPRPAGASALAR